MARPNVSATPPGCCGSEWTVTYSYYKGIITSAEAVVNGNVVEFTCKVDGEDSNDTSREIPGQVVIASQSTSGRKHVVKIMYRGSDLHDYFQ